jgi:hypothetical protein
MSIERGEGAGPSGSVVWSGRVQLSDETVRIGPPVEPQAHSEVKIQLVREDGVIRAIDVTCACGERIRIRCEYDE